MKILGDVSLLDANSILPTVAFVRHPFNRFVSGELNLEDYGVRVAELVARCLTA
jgi:hypothetical protein